jgi:hypothetical protein
VILRLIVGRRHFTQVIANSRRALIQTQGITELIDMAQAGEVRSARWRHVAPAAGCHGEPIISHPKRVRLDSRGWGKLFYRDGSFAID